MFLDLIIFFWQALPILHGMKLPPEFETNGSLTATLKKGVVAAAGPGRRASSNPTTVVPTLSICDHVWSLCDSRQRAASYETHHTGLPLSTVSNMGQP